MNRIVKNYFKGGFILLLLFFLGWDYLGMGYYISLILFPYIIFASILKRFIDKESLWLLFFSVFFVAILFSYPLIWSKFGLGKMFSFLVLPFSAYLTGKFIIAENSHDDQLFLWLFLLTLTVTAMPILSVLNNIYKNGFVGESRNIILLNGIEIERSATGIDGYIAISASFIGFLVFKVDNKETRFYKWIYILLAFLSILCILRIGSRTGLVVLAISFLLTTAYNVKKQGVLLYFLLISVSFVFIMSIISSSNPLLSYMAERANENNASSLGARLPLWHYYYFHLWDYPWGNIPSKYSYTLYAHNLWLDVARLTGLYPMIFLLVFNFLALKIFFRFINNKNLSSFYRSIALMWHIAFYSVFFVEPVMEGLFSLFIFYCFFVGMMKQSNFISKQRTVINKTSNKNREPQNYLIFSPTKVRL